MKYPIYGAALIAALLVPLAAKAQTVGCEFIGHPLFGARRTGAELTADRVPGPDAAVDLYFLPAPSGAEIHITTKWTGGQTMQIPSDQVAALIKQADKGVTAIQSGCRADIRYPSLIGFSPGGSIGPKPRPPRNPLPQ